MSTWMRHPHANPEVRDLPVASPMGIGQGPYGSFNSEESMDHKPDRDLSQSRTATLIGALYSEQEVKDILYAAYELAQKDALTLLDEAIQEKVDPEDFSASLHEKANDLFEMCVHVIITTGHSDPAGKQLCEPYDLRQLTPAGVVNFLDQFMDRNSGLVTQLEILIRDAYSAYLERKLENG